MMAIVRFFPSPSNHFSNDGLDSVVVERSKCRAKHV